jgi:hypothetical protein
MQQNMGRKVKHGLPIHFLHYHAVFTQLSVHVARSKTDRQPVAVLSNVVNIVPMSHNCVSVYTFP